MNLIDLNPPLLELPEHQIWHRVQRARARFDSVRVRGFIMAPAGTLSGRFDLEGEATAYLADGELTALYESPFRREARSCHLDRLKERTLAGFRTPHPRWLTFALALTGRLFIIREDAAEPLGTETGPGQLAWQEERRSLGSIRDVENSCRRSDRRAAHSVRIAQAA